MRFPNKKGGDFFDEFLIDVFQLLEMIFGIFNQCS